MSCLLNNNKNSEFCVSAGTQITLADGSNVPIESVRVGDIVLSRSSHGVTGVSVSANLNRGLRPCYELEFSDGRNITCTGDHRILTGKHTIRQL